MESTGEPSMIQVSEATYKELSKTPDFRLEPRGQMQVRGQDCKTFWLKSKKFFDPLVKLVGDAREADMEFDYGEF